MDKKIIHADLRDPIRIYSGLLKQELTAECGEASSFLEACDAHDTCYQTCGSDRIGSCDASFSWNLWVVCNPLSGQCRVDCLWWRDQYVGAVLLLGEVPWKNNQVNACACCNCE